MKLCKDCCYFDTHLGVGQEKCMRPITSYIYGTAPRRSWRPVEERLDSLGCSHKAKYFKEKRDVLSSNN